MTVGNRTLDGVTPDPPPALPTEPPPCGVGMAIARYALARTALVAVVAAVLTVAGVPVLVAILVALVMGLPLSLLLLKKLRTDLDSALAYVGERRRAQRAQLRAQLRGEQPSDSSAAAPGSAELAQPQADGGADRPGEHQHGGITEHCDELPASDTTEHPSNR